jgi:hypothetical protein
MPINRGYCLALIVLAFLSFPNDTRAEAPLSAIDWLSQSVSTPAVVVPPEEPAVAGTALPDAVAVSVIGAPSPDAVGLLSTQVTGLPRSLWGLGLTEEIAALVTTERTDTLPALQQLLITVLLAEADPPADAGNKGRLLLSRVDKLLDMGALDQAEALLAATGSTEAEVFRRTFDVALLTGSEDAACEKMRSAPNLAPTFPARIFCLARSGDWNAAALALRTGQALGYVTEEDDALLSRFLDPDLYEDEPAPAPPSKPTPLVWRMFAAIGEPLPTSNLPVAFAHAELQDTSGWKAQIEAAERLVKAGAVSPNLLLGLYTDRRPAASGGVWDRVDAVQDFEAALESDDPNAIAKTLPLVWAQMVSMELEVPFAKLYAMQLAKHPLQGEAGKLVFRIQLLSDQYERIAANHKAADQVESFLMALARGSLDDVVAPDSLGRAIAPAFVDPNPAPEALLLLDQGRLGEAVLMAIDQVGRGVQGDLKGVTEGLSLLRHVGLEEVARRTALELMLLERRG